MSVEQRIQELSREIANLRQNLDQTQDKDDRAIARLMSGIDAAFSRQHEQDLDDKRELGELAGELRNLIKRVDNLNGSDHGNRINDLERHKVKCDERSKKFEENDKEQRSFKSWVFASIITALAVLALEAGKLLFSVIIDKPKAKAEEGQMITVGR